MSVWKQLLTIAVFYVLFFSYKITVIQGEDMVSFEI